MEEQEIAAAIGWMLVASGALAVVLSSVFRRHGYTATTAGLLLAILGCLIAGIYGRPWSWLCSRWPVTATTSTGAGLALHRRRNGASDAQQIGTCEG